MAIYRLSVSMVKRSTGRSAVASAAYRAGENMVNERDGVTHNYGNRQGVESAEILVPEGAPEWAGDRSSLWNGVEQSEVRKDAQTAREIVLSLPHELSADQRRELAYGFVREQFVEKGMVADVAIHSPHHDGDERNHHAHVMLTTREIDADGFGKKNRDWNGREPIKEWREAWEGHVNRSLEQAHVQERVDHRSLQDQREEAQDRAREASTEHEQAEWEGKAIALDREPEPKLGRAAGMERRGIRTAVGDMVRDARELRDTALEWSKEALEAAKGMAQEWRSNMNDQLREMMVHRASKNEERLKQQLIERQKEREAEKVKEMVRERSRDRGMSR